ncbi:hypothetical protein V6N11_050707 [Hibiscus sabdariffa]|uniref:Uncharacterized protein n=2 Tax=Hibiscus sabdariffa TaxID=183260 RepID=A0ABR2TAM4_9ROSI
MLAVSLRGATNPLTILLLLVELVHDFFDFCSTLSQQDDFIFQDGDHLARLAAWSCQEGNTGNGQFTCGEPTKKLWCLPLGYIEFKMAMGGEDTPCAP